MKYLLSDSFEFYLLLFCDNLVGKLFKLLTPKHLGRTRPKLSYNNISLFQRQNWKSSYHTISTIAFSNTKHKTFFSEVLTLSKNDKVTVKWARDLQLYQYFLILDIPGQNLQHSKRYSLKRILQLKRKTKKWQPYKCKLQQRRWASIIPLTARECFFLKNLFASILNFKSWRDTLRSEKTRKLQRLVKKFLRKLRYLIPPHQTTLTVIKQRSGLRSNLDGESLEKFFRDEKRFFRSSYKSYIPPSYHIDTFLKIVWKETHKYTTGLYRKVPSQI